MDLDTSELTDEQKRALADELGLDLSELGLQPSRSDLQAPVREISYQSIDQQRPLTSNLQLTKQASNLRDSVADNFETNLKTVNQQSAEHKSD